MFGFVSRWARKAWDGVKGVGAKLAVACGLIAGAATSASAQGVELFDTGVDVEGVAEAMGTALGAIIVTCLTIYGAFLLVRKALRACPESKERLRIA